MFSQRMFAFLAIVAIGGLSGCDGVTSSLASGTNGGSGPGGLAEEPKCELRLELPATITIKKGGEQAKAQVKNAGKSNVTLVMPGDGSEWGWRTPITGWSFLSADSKEEHPTVPPPERRVRCGNINSLKQDEVFTLKPGETRDMPVYLSLPQELAPGKYRAVFYYKNIPNKNWSGVPLGKHDAKAMRLVTKSTPVELVSNEAPLTVTE